MVGSVSVHPCVCVCVCVFFFVCFFAALALHVLVYWFARMNLIWKSNVRQKRHVCQSILHFANCCLEQRNAICLYTKRMQRQEIILTRVPCLSLELHGSCFWQIVAVTVMLGIKTTVLSFQGADSLICNLQQNPLSRPIVGRLCPTFLKSGCMWLLLPGDSTSDSERWLTAKDKVVFCMLFFGVFSFCSLLA